jgi:hypothetical protein
MPSKYPQWIFIGYESPKISMCCFATLFILLKGIQRGFKGFGLLRIFIPWLFKSHYLDSILEENLYPCDLVKLLFIFPWCQFDQNSSSF